MNIQHVKLDYDTYILVVDGVRGPVCQIAPTTHPAGVIAYPYGGYSVPPALQGKVFVLAADAEVEEIDDSACEESLKAMKVWTEVRKTCVEVKLSRYGEEAPAVLLEKQP